MESYIMQAMEHIVGYWNYYQNTKIKCQQKSVFCPFLQANGVLDVLLSNLSVLLTAVQCTAALRRLQFFVTTQKINFLLWFLLP